MTSSVKASLYIKPEIAKAIELGKPVVALESTVITHGLPYPENIKFARDLEMELREEGCIPATIAVMKEKFILASTPHSWYNSSILTR